jgi:hypothetical protein
MPDFNFIPAPEFRRFREEDYAEVPRLPKGESMEGREESLIITWALSPRTSLTRFERTAYGHSLKAQLTESITSTRQ